MIRRDRDGSRRRPPLAPQPGRGDGSAEPRAKHLPDAGRAAAPGRRRDLRARAEALAAEGLYDPGTEHDACGVGLVADVRGRPSRAIVHQALSVLSRLAHRGAVGSDPLTGDGAGILLQIPHRLFARDCAERGINLPPAGRYGVGMLFLPNDAWSHPPRIALVEQIVEEEGLRVLGWRPVPVDQTQCGPLSLETVPQISQIFVAEAESVGGHGGGRDDSAFDADGFERRLWIVRKRIEHAAHDPSLPGGDPFYVCSLSSRTIVYKGLLLPSRLAAFYGDLADPEVESALALVHQRFSTNTFPAWERAHPYRMIAHNGEINTLRGNVEWMRAREKLLTSAELGSHVERLLPVIDPSGSDSAMFDNCVELLAATGRSLPHSVAMMIPEAWQGDREMPEANRAFYEYHASLMEPWDGPACMVFSDGRVIGATLDRNGLRPARYFLTQDDLLVLASESGVTDIPSDQVRMRGRLSPGRMLLVDTVAGRIVDDAELKAGLAALRPYGQWVAEQLVRTRDLPVVEAAAVAPRLTELALEKALRLFGYSREDLELLLWPMATTGKEPIGSMGDDTPLAILSNEPQLLFQYFRQLFAQVTNPPIDPLRESLVMSLRTTLGPEHNLFDDGPQGCHQLALDSPILTGERIAQIRALAVGDLRAATVSTLCPWPAREVELTASIERMTEAAVDAIAAGASLLILSDRVDLETPVANLGNHGFTVATRGTSSFPPPPANAAAAPVPSLLALAAVHCALIERGLRQGVGLIVESGEPREVMHYALLIGYGAGAVHPYVALDAVASLVQQEATARRATATDEMASTAAKEAVGAGDSGIGDAVTIAVDRYVAAIEGGLLKILSKMGISTLQAYRGAQIFEAVGLHRTLVERFFPGTPSRIGGLDLALLAEEQAQLRARALDQPGALLPSGGRYRWRRDGEQHAYAPKPIATLQQAVRAGDYVRYKEFSGLADGEARNCANIRGLLRIRKPATKTVPLAEVESAESIVRRFRTGAMSYGSISKEAHETLAIAMNRLGARSNSGEGGEDPARYLRDADGSDRRSAIKQVASGRFGVTLEYLWNADELQIKMAQGAKPGEGGHLPGHKVDESIARTRHATPGVGLISPPPHHDIYSIEDLAQLIFDLKNANERADVSVKLVSEVGVGTIAAGVAKAKADGILISGHAGGTGAAPLSSIKHAGVPWELGLAEAQQVLVMNELRGRVHLEVDGQIMTGRDVVVAALLGAERFGIGTAALVAMGCVLMRACHLNTCPVGIATQNPLLRKRFMGKPEHVENYMLFIAEEVREIMADLGMATFDELIGRVDLLEQARDRDVTSSLLAKKVARLDLGPLLREARVPDHVARRWAEPQQHSLADVFDRRLIAAAESAILGQGAVAVTDQIRNTDRAVGTLLSAEVLRRHGPAGLADGSVMASLFGSAGQSFGAFLIGGVELRLEGEANDAVGKGLSGGRIVVRPPRAARYAPEDNTIIGNVALYGATAGELFINGRAGERFAVRNSGATAVVEGVGDHGCEYMTGGVVLVLGPTGRNFAAGMTGGVAFVLDTNDRFAKRVNLAQVETGVLGDDDWATVLTLLRRHLGHTQSPLAARLLDAAEGTRHRLVKVMPIEYRRALELGDGRVSDGRSEVARRAAGAEVGVASGTPDGDLAGALDRGTVAILSGVDHG